MARSATSIYIDDTAVRALNMGGKRPQRWATVPLEAGLVKDGVVLNEAEVAARIRKMWGQQGMDSRKVIAGIRSPHNPSSFSNSVVFHVNASASW